MKLLGSILVAGAIGASVKRSASPKSGRGRSGSPMSGSRSGSPKAPMDSPMDSPMKSGSPEWDFEIPEELMADKEKMQKMMKKFMMIKKMMKELKMGGNGVFAPVKNDIETDVELEQNFVTNINIDFNDDEEPRRPRSPHHKGPKSPEHEHDSRSPDHEVGKIDLDAFFELLENDDMPGLLVNIQNFINQNNMIDTDVNMEILNGEHDFDFERPEEPEKQPEHGWEVWDGTNQDEGRAAFDGEKAFIKFVNFMEEHGDKLPKILVNVQNFINQNNVMDTDVNMEIMNNQEGAEEEDKPEEGEFGWPVWNGDKSQFDGHNWRDMDFELEDVVMYLKEKLDLDGKDFKGLMKDEKAKKMFKEICEQVKKMMKH